MKNQRISEKHAYAFCFDPYVLRRCKASLTFYAHLNTKHPVSANTARFYLQSHPPSPSLTHILTVTLSPS